MVMASRSPTILVLLAALARVQCFPAIGAMSTRRVMLLHGQACAGSSFLRSPTRNGAKDFLAGVPAEGLWNSNGLWNKPGMKKTSWFWHISAANAGHADGNWYEERDDGTLVGMDESIAQVEAEIEEQAVTCLVGLEQGGLLAALVAARAALGESECSRLRCAVVCGAAMPSDGPHADLLRRLAATPGASLPTLHCLSKADTISPPELGQELAACFGPSAELLWHDLGNAMPSRSWWKDSDAFLERAWEAGA